MKTTASSSEQTSTLDGLSQTQRDRLAYIEFRLYFLGEVGRSDLKKRFGVAPAVATRDFALYRSLFKDNITFDNLSKTYVIGERFVPAFQHVSDRVLTALSEGFGDGVNPVVGPLIPCEIPVALNRPRMDVLAPVTRAIYKGRAVRLHYISHTSGATTREIVPFAMVSDGLRWHVRAFCRMRRTFHDFVISRMDKTEVILDGEVEQSETSAEDIQWNRIVELELVPHPDKKSPEIAEKDFGMTDGVLQLKLRAAMAGYVLRQWHIDCTSDHRLQDQAFRLWLRNHLALYGVESAKFAPGYVSPE
ncbi:WYL domain-containing protein [Thauera sp. Sel9]|uniref:WYL domain-containing protein n=1 Tax=Thauera sp. Sel9 TaxID=2974299 RepID=UPI0021E15779|nr:WYL domain-containing protein [Thauera sp. Sel9]MCV2219833.1 WYL domain-containing protein [Thauera sp. Sel9]